MTRIYVLVDKKTHHVDKICDSKRQVRRVLHKSKHEMEVIPVVSEFYKS